MLTHSFNPHTEKAALYEAIVHFQQRWEHHHTLDAIFALADAIERAEDVCFELQRDNLDSQSDLALIAINLQLLLGMARQELAQAQDEALEEIGHRMATEASRRSPDPVCAAGTILSCPECGEGLYKVTMRATVDDIVLDDGMILQPLNTTIPKRDAWRALACPHCGGRYHRDGKLHTLQNGWV